MIHIKLPLTLCIFDVKPFARSKEGISIAWASVLWSYAWRNNKEQRGQINYTTKLPFLSFNILFWVIWCKIRQNKDQNGKNFIQKGIFYEKIWIFLLSDFFIIFPNFLDFLILLNFFWLFLILLIIFLYF